MTVVQMCAPEQLSDTLVEAVAQIYESSFPPTERVPIRDLVTSLHKGSRILCLAIENHRPVGFATVIERLQPQPMSYLEFLAVDPPSRNRGVGGAMVDFIAVHLSTTTNNSGLIFEVESHQSGSDAERVLSSRRINFYQRHGADIVACAPQYRSPNLLGGESLSMLLMWLPLRACASPPAGLELRDCVLALYYHAYGRTAKDSLLQKVLAQLTC